MGQRFFQKTALSEPLSCNTIPSIVFQIKETKPYVRIQISYPFFEHKLN